MRIIVLDSLLGQAQGNTIPTESLPRIFSEFQRLAELEEDGRETVEAYLKNHHGIRMKGTDKIYKYELTGGDRILYAHSSDIPWLREEGSYVLLRFSKHDVQGNVAKKIDLSKRRGYAYIKEIVEKMDEVEIDAIYNSDITLEDYVALAEILNSKDYTVWHKAYVVNDEREYAELSSDEWEVYLSDEQDSCIESFFDKPSPTLIIGGAGTGKTLIAVHVLHDYVKVNSEKKGCYFTQSAELRNKVRMVFRRINDGSEADNAEFLDINEYCLQRCDLKHSSMVYTNEFQEFIESRPDIKEKCRGNGIDPIVLWTEIRGIIKGGMSANWSHNYAIQQDEFPSPIKSLVDKGYLTRDQNDKKRIWLTESVNATYDRLIHDEDLSGKDKENVRFALERFSRFDPNMRMLSEREYISVSEERSSIELEKRGFAWQVCQEYDEYLKNENKYDENDLIRMMFDKGFAPKPIFGLTVIDEVQDYTELQLFLIRKMTKGNKILFAGDEHQNINPASFSESRLKSLFYGEENSELIVKRLHMNYRCPQEIIDRTNALATVRRKAIGSGSAENEALEIAQRSEDVSPIRYCPVEPDAFEFLLKLFQMPRAVILVASQEQKKEILDKIHHEGIKIATLMGEEKYKARLSSAVFTVAEIKGIEYEYVLCYDLIGAYSKAWERILADDVRKDTKYRYYFNVLYVAMTRAQRFLCFMDDEVYASLEASLDLQTIDAYDAGALYLDRLSDSDILWLDQARELEKAGKYKEALQNYIAAKAAPEEPYRCQYYIAREENEYDDAIVYAILMNSSESVEMVSVILEDIASPELNRLAKAYIALNKPPIKYDLRRVNMSYLIATCIKEENREAVEKVFLGSLRKAISSYANAIQEVI